MLIRSDRGALSDRCPGRRRGIPTATLSWRPLRPISTPMATWIHRMVAQSAPTSSSFWSADAARRMHDREVGAFLSANLMCGGNAVYRRVGRDVSWAGTVCLAGAFGAPDLMGRRPFAWTISTRLPRGTDAESPTQSWSGEDALQVVRSVLAVPWKALPCESEAPSWERDQGVLF